MPVMEVMEVIKMREVVSWQECSVERMYASPSPPHATAHIAEVMDASKTMASKTTHGAGGQGRWHGKHCH
jgi:hypothetical protein